MKGLFGLLNIVLALLGIVILAGYLVRNHRATASLADKAAKSGGLELPQEINPNNLGDVKGYVEDQVKANNREMDRRLKCQIDLEADCEK